MKTLLFADFETTGTGPSMLPLEFAATLVPQDGEPVAFHTFIRVNDRVGRMEAGARSMHIKSGLLDDLEKAIDPPSIDEAGVLFRHWLNAMGAMSELTLAGRGIGFDRAIIERHWPGIVDRLTYYNLDLSATRRLLEAIGAEVEHPTEHRARLCVAAAMRDYDRYRRLLRYGVDEEKRLASWVAAFGKASSLGRPWLGVSGL